MAQGQHEHLIDSPDLGEVVVDAEAIRRRVAELGAEITADYEGRAPLLIGVLKGVEEIAKAHGYHSLFATYEVDSLEQLDEILAEDLGAVRAVPMYVRVVPSSA